MAMLIITSYLQKFPLECLHGYTMVDLFSYLHILGSSDRYFFKTVSNSYL